MDSVVYIADCVDDSRVVFPRVVNEGDQIYYTPYVDDADSGTLHGYIHSLQEVVP